MGVPAETQKYNFYTSRYLCYDIISVKEKKNPQKQKCQRKSKKKKKTYTNYAHLTQSEAF